MATVIIESIKTCDMCMKEKKHFITGKGFKMNKSMGVIQSQSDRWDKTISFTIDTSIPYSPSDDICTDCVREAFEGAISKFEVKG